MKEADEEAALWGADHALFYLLKVIRMTGFMKGLYTDAEMKSDNVKVGVRGAISLALMFCVFFFKSVYLGVCHLYADYDWVICELLYTHIPFIFGNWIHANFIH